MEDNQFKVDGYVRVVKDGKYDNVIYRVGEIWKTRIGFSCPSSDFVYVERNGKNTMMSCTDTEKYGIECEWVGMTKPKEEIIYQIY